MAWRRARRRFGTARAASIAGIFPPSLSDDAWRLGYLNAGIAQLEAELSVEALRARLERADIPGLRDRTAHHALFNRCLAQATRRRGLGYMSAFDDLLSEAGVAADHFVGPSDGGDHHLDEPAVRPVVVPLLRSLIDASAVC